MQDEIERFKKLSQKLKEMSEKKIRYEEQYNSKKEALTELLKEIKEAGYDPKDLANIIKTKEEELKTALNTFETELQQVSSKLSEIEGAN
jgi:mannitol/fructose-specific phosphotransferase system IIA component (Ntr-type)